MVSHVFVVPDLFATQFVAVCLPDTSGAAERHLEHRGPRNDDSIEWNGGGIRSDFEDTTMCAWPLPMVDMEVPPRQATPSDEKRSAERHLEHRGLKDSDSHLP